jgi:hypothetical protein
MRNVVLLSLLLLSLAGCLPIRETYYRPSGMGSAQAGACGSGPADTMAVKLPGAVSLYVRAEQIPGGSVNVSFYYLVPQGSTIRLATDSVAVTDEDSHETARYLIQSVRQQCGTGASDYGCIKDVRPTAPMDGATIKDGSLFGMGTSARSMSFELQTDRNWRAFSVRPPDVEINGIARSLTGVKFVRTTGIVWAAVSC